MINLRNIKHNNVVPVYGVFQQNDTFWLVMEQVKGPNLKVYLASLLAITFDEIVKYVL